MGKLLPCPIHKQLASSLKAEGIRSPPSYAPIPLGLTALVSPPFGGQGSAFQMEARDSDSINMVPAKTLQEMPL